MRSEAYLSEDRKFRYWLLRVWDDSLPMMANIGCNPSTADETKDDPTIRKDMGFARRLGYGGLLKLNVGAYRATDPKKWLEAADPFGPENRIEDFWRYLGVFNVQTTVAAWGKCIGRFAWKGLQLADGLAAHREIFCFGKTADGTPRHTLMLPYTTKLVKFAVSTQLPAQEK